MKMKAWTITQLKREMGNNLFECNSALEYSMCKAICGKEMRELAKSLTRKLTPCETSIMENL